MEPSIVAYQPGEDVYLVEVDETNGQVFELKRLWAFPPRPIADIMKRGYWVDNDLSTADQQRVMEAFSRAKGATRRS